VWSEDSVDVNDLSAPRWRRLSEEDRVALFVHEMGHQCAPAYYQTAEDFVSRCRIRWLGARAERSGKE
jgi:hypothetical protein